MNKTVKKNLELRKKLSLVFTVIFMQVPIVLLSQEKFDTTDSSTIKNINGLWTSNRNEYVPAGPYDDASMDLIIHHSDLFIEGDSIWRLSYPCEAQSREVFSVKNMNILNDTVFYFKEERYVRVPHYDSSAINYLKALNINPECLIGEWRLVRTEGYGDGTGVKFIYPFYVPDTVVITNQELQGRFIKLNIKGKERNFICELTKKSTANQLILTPADSWPAKEKVMWERDWNLPNLSKKELNRLRRNTGESVGFELILNK